MPSSVQRHNLARFRSCCGITQSEVAQMVGCSLSTIQAVEIRKLALSESLATRISEALGFFDKEWLLKNDLSAPVPRILYQRVFKPGTTEAALADLFSRCFAVLARMDKEQRRELECHLAVQLEALKKGKEPPRMLEIGSVIKAIDFFREHPEQLDPDLRWVNLEGLRKLLTTSG